MRVNNQDKQSYNERRRTSPFVGFPEYDLGPASQPPALAQPRNLVPVGQMVQGGVSPQRGISAPDMMPQQQLPPQGQPTGKKILGMPKDQFIALMGSIAHAFGGDSPSGRMGTGLINMAGMMRQERLGRDKATAEAAKERRAAATKERERLRTKKEKVPSAWESVYKEMEGKVNPETGHPFTAAEKFAAYKKIGAKEEKVARDKGFKQIDGVWHTGTWGEGDQFTQRRQATKAEITKLTETKPAAGEKPKEKSWAEKRARRKELREAELTIFGADPKTGVPNIEHPESQILIDFFNEHSDKPYVLHRTPGTPGKETGYFDLERDIEAVPSTLEKVDVSTPEKIRDSNLPIEMKLKLLRERFGFE